MAYLPSDSPIGPNSLEAPPQWLADCSDARASLLNRDAAEGQRLVYDAIAGLPSFYDISPQLGDNAARILQQSAVARARGIFGGTPEQSESDDEYVTPPTIVPLNATMEQVNGCERIKPVPTFAPSVQVEQPRMVMPAPAPLQIRSDKGTILYTEPAPVAHVAVLPRPTPVEAPAPRETLYASIESHARGLTGFAPPWGDAWALMDTSTTGGGAAAAGLPGWLGLALLAGGILLIGGAVTGGRKIRKRTAMRKAKR